jgi:hypothetical protein
LTNLEDMFDEIWKLSYENKDEWDLLLVDENYKQREEKLHLISLREQNLQKCLDAVVLVV